MRVGLIVPANLKYAPYVQYYLSVLKEKSIDYKLMLWNKAGIKEDAECILNFECADTNRKRILFGHILFAHKCRKYVKSEHIDHLIVFTIAPLFFLGVHFLRQFRNKLIIDIRDDSPFRRKFPNKLKQICSLAKNIVVSSKSYESWTGRETILCHNADVELIKKYYELNAKEKKEAPYTIVFAGSMIEADINISTIRKLKNSKLFSFGFIGKTNEFKEKIINEVTENGYSNVWFEGTYEKSEIVNKYRTYADFINIFRQNTIVNKNALPNKLYDAIVSAVPVVVFRHNEAIVKYVEKYQLGIVLDDSELDMLEKSLLAKIQKFDYSLFEKGRRAFLNEVLGDQNNFEGMLLSFVI